VIVAIQKSYNMKYVWAMSLIAAMGGLLFGYDWVVVGGAKPFYEVYFHITEMPNLQGWGVSSALLGCILGAVLSGIFSDMFGRKRLLIASALLFVCTSIGTAFAWNFYWYNIFRIFGGIGIGLASNLSPMYIAEISPASYRGRFVSVYQLAIVCGVLSAQTINWLISLHDNQLPDNATASMILQSWNGNYGWRWMFGSAAIPASVFFMLMLLVPESPRWLVKNNQSALAEKILSRIGGGEHARMELADIRNTISSEEVSHVRFKDLMSPKLLWMMVIGAVIAVYSQWCGINTIFYYSSDIFKAAGFTIKAIMLNIVITGTVSMLFTFFAIATVDHWGRKLLTLVGSAGLAISFLLISRAFNSGTGSVLVVVYIVVAMAFYSFSLATMTWVLLSELFPNKIRGAAMSIAVLALWVGNFTVSYTFPSLNKAFGTGNMFLLYALINFAGFMFVLFALRETKGKSLEQIEREFIGDNGCSTETEEMASHR
jgi:sugar porter (SP) family MFS transporter